MVYEFDFSFPGVGEDVLFGAAGLLVGVTVVILLLALAFSLVSYILSAVGMYRIAKRRGIHHSWLAWIPVGNAWLLGSISDHYQYIVKHKNTKRRQILLVLNIASVFVGILYGVVVAVWAMLSSDAGFVGMTVANTLIYFLMMGVSVAVTVFCYIAYYDLFQSCRPGNAVMFLVLGIIFNVTLPFFVFACSGSDQGMPARRAARPVTQQVLAPQPPVEPAAEEAAAEEEIPVVETEVTEQPFEE